jgi:uncharacterized C2H2 Zn-finger protein
MKQNETNLSPKIPKYTCELCEMSTNNKKDYNKHMSTAKHEKREKCNKMKQICPQKSPKEEVCEKCDGVFRNRTAMWRHKNKCKGKTIEMMEVLKMMMENQENSTNTLKEVFLDVLKQNADEFKELVKESQQAITINKMTNCNNKNFNLNFFLNDKCKNAMNIMDFIKSINLTLDDYESYIGGYSNTLSGILVRELKNTDIHIRPIHCTDFKRKVIYVRENGEWKCDSDNKITQKAIKYLSHYNYCQYKKWNNEYPESLDTKTSEHDYYMKLVTNSFPGSTDEEIESSYNKIIRCMLKEVTINKLLE